MNTNAFRHSSSLLRKEPGTHACERQRENGRENARNARERRTLSQGGADRQTLLEAKISSVCETRGISLARPTRARSFHSSRPKTFPEHIEGTKSATRPSRHHTVTPLAREMFLRADFLGVKSLSLHVSVRANTLGRDDATSAPPATTLTREKREKE
jgi:hypothetical protein